MIPEKEFEALPEDEKMLGDPVTLFLTSSDGDIVLALAQV